MKPREDGPLLSGQQHDALIKELFAHWNAVDPDAHHCFCGSDDDLIRAVQGYRDQEARQR